MSVLLSARKEIVDFSHTGSIRYKSPPWELSFTGAPSEPGYVQLKQ